MRSNASWSATSSPAAHEQLGDVRGGLAGHPAALGLDDRHVAPAQGALALGLDVALDQPDGLLALGLVLGQEAHGDAVAAELGQLDARLRAEELVGELDEDARAVAGVGVRSLGAAVLQAVEREQAALDDLV